VAEFGVKIMWGKIKKFTRQFIRNLKKSFLNVNFRWDIAPDCTAVIPPWSVLTGGDNEIT
jgi:hypothetical protein